MQIRKCEEGESMAKEKTNKTTNKNTKQEAKKQKKSESLKQMDVTTNILIVRTYH